MPGPTGLVNKLAPENVSADEGGLHIVAYKNGEEYWSGGIDTHAKVSWQYGYYECKARYPDVPGIFAGFFVVNAEGWPPEIDASEVLRNDYRMHLAIRKELGVDYETYINFSDYLLGEWHRFGFIWEPGVVVFLLDGIEYWRSYDYSPDMPMSVYFYFEMGEFQVPNDGLLPTTLDIEYIKIWQKS